MAENGGPVVLVQLDNELMGFHVWSGAPKTRAYFEDSAEYLVTLPSGAAHLFRLGAMEVGYAAVTVLGR